MAWAKPLALVLFGAAVCVLAQSPAMAAAPLLAGGSVVKPAVSPGFGSPYTVEPAGQPVPANFSKLVVTTQFPYLFTATQNGAFSGSVTSSIWQDPTTSNLAFSYSFNNLQTSRASYARRFDASVVWIQHNRLRRRHAHYRSLHPAGIDLME
jgi:hypothetical protein